MRKPHLPNIRLQSVGRQPVCFWKQPVSEERHGEGLVLRLLMVLQLCYNYNNHNDLLL